MDKSDILICGRFSMVLIFLLALWNTFSEVVLDLSIIFYYYINILYCIYSFIYLLNYLLELCIYLLFFGFSPFKTVGEFMGCVQGQGLGVRASSSGVYPAGKLQWHFACGFDFGRGL